MEMQKLLKVIDNAKKNRTAKLFLAKEELKELPPEVGDLKNLLELDLSGNDLETLPPEIGQLKRVKKLGFEITNISAREDYDNRKQLIIEMTLEGSRKAKGTGSIIETVLLTCEQLKLEVTRINCYEE